MNFNYIVLLYESISIQLFQFNLSDIFEFSRHYAIKIDFDRFFSIEFEYEKKRNWF